MRNIVHVNCNIHRIGGTRLLSEKNTLKIKKKQFTGDEEGHYILMEDIIQEKKL